MYVCMCVCVQELVLCLVSACFGILCYVLQMCLCVYVCTYVCVRTAGDHELVLCIVFVRVVFVFLAYCLCVYVCTCATYVRVVGDVEHMYVSMYVCVRHMCVLSRC
jgi:hypothetical protein